MAKVWWKSAAMAEKRAENGVKDVVKMVAFHAGKILTHGFRGMWYNADRREPVK